MKKLFTTAFYLVYAERPFRDFPSLLSLQRLNGLQLGQAYSNHKQTRNFVHFIAEKSRLSFVHLLQNADFFSVCFDDIYSIYTVYIIIIMIIIIMIYTVYIQYI